MRIHGAKHVAMADELFKWFCHSEANNIPVKGPTVKGGISEFTLTVDTELKCFTVCLQLFIHWWNIPWKSMSRGLIADVDLAGK